VISRLGRKLIIQGFGHLARLDFFGQPATKAAARRGISSS
jgi:hypothetical protein